MTSTIHAVETVLHFWFGELNQDNHYYPEENTQQRWWKKSTQFDDTIREQFLASIFAAATQNYDHYLGGARSRLAVIILLDQFTRNVFRDSAMMYAYDSIALKLSLTGIKQGLNKKLHPIERVFLYMPLEHAEDIHIQEQCVALFQALALEVPAELRQSFESFTDFAERHRVIIEKFGRFPHRNDLLCRKSTPAEIDFLNQPGSHF